jgi:hypothetical protein
MHCRLRVGSERRLPGNRLHACRRTGLPFALLILCNFSESRMESMLSNVDHEGADEDWVPEDDMNEDYALLESVQAAEIDSI